MVDYYPRIFAIIFCRTKRETQEVADKLIRDGYNAESLHGDLSQQQRDLTMQKFRQHLTQLLVATDVAARGLDVDDLTHVINFGMPDDIESYTHRSGRTGRAGKKGTSIAIIHSREKSKIRAVEKEIGKQFVQGQLPTPQEICTKQLYKVMDEIEKTDVNEDDIAPFMDEINRHFEFIDKEDIIKKMVSREFGRFLAYYADAPEIEQPSGKGGGKGDKPDRKRGERGGRRGAEQGYRRLFINLGKTDGFYPGEVMQFVNRYVDGRQEVGHIDLHDKYSYIEVPERDAERVMRSLDGTRYRGRDVRCNDADDTSAASRGGSRGGARGGQRGAGRSFDRFDRGPARSGGGGAFSRFDKKQKGRKAGGDDFGGGDTGDWRQFFQNDSVKLKGEEPDFSEEGWARRKPRKK